MSRENYGVIIETGASPDRYEMRVAFVMSDYFGSDIVFRKNSQSYSPDLLVIKTKQLQAEVLQYH